MKIFFLNRTIKLNIFTKLIKILTLSFPSTNFRTKNNIKQNNNKNFIL